MRAMIMAAGRGCRLRPITDRLPKPLVAVKGKPLIVYHLEALSRVGITEIVINLNYLGDKIKGFLGNGHSFGVDIIYSVEDELLGVAGGVAKALPLLGDKPFIVMNGDVFTDYDLKGLLVSKLELAHIVLVPNPEHHPKGDYSLIGEMVILPNTWTNLTYTYAGIGLYHPDLFREVSGPYALSQLFLNAILMEALTGELYTGRWTDVGTVERLESLRKVMGEN